MLKKIKECVILTCDFEYAFKFRKTEEKFHELWRMKSSARESLKDWLLTSDVSPKMSEVCSNACSELIENCIKFSQDGSSAVVSIKVENKIITVETINSADKKDKTFLIKDIEKLNDAPDLKLLFAEKLLKPDKNRSRLGLVKIAMETGGTISLVHESDEDIVHMKLEMKTE